MLSVLFFSHLCYTNETKGTQENTTIWRYLPCMMTQTKGSSNTDSSSMDNSLLASNPHRTNSSMDNHPLVSSPHPTNNNNMGSNPHHTDNNNMNSNNMGSKLRMDLNPHHTASNNMGSSLMASSRSMDSLSCNTSV